MFFTLFLPLIAAFNWYLFEEINFRVEMVLFCVLLGPVVDSSTHLTTLFCALYGIQIITVVCVPLVKIFKDSLS